MLLIAAAIGMMLLPLELSAKSDDPLSQHDEIPRWWSPQGSFRVPTIPSYANIRSPEEWRAAIDTAWGAGLPTELKLAIFDSYLKTIDEEFACFNGVNFNWDSLNSIFRAEIASGVSRGRFAAIINHSVFALSETHTTVGDGLVNWETRLEPGVPVQVVGSWGDIGHFGAGLTPLSDSTLLVFKAIPDHPLGLEPGDIVIGYEGVPWKRLVYDLLAAELPLRGPWGSSPSARTHSLLVSAGLNWHLFSTIDILKYSTGDILHLETNLLADAEMELFCGEQMDVPGVPMPRDLDENPVSWGIVDGTHIGYVYAWSFMGNSGQQFHEAIDTLLQLEVEGLILDLRLNRGGYISNSEAGLELLFNSSDTTIAFASRCNPENRFEMCKSQGPWHLPNSPTSHYDKPIAVLTGPGALSAGDHTALMLTFHPRARLFGRPTAGTFSLPSGIALGDSSHLFYSSFAKEEAYFPEDPDQFISRTDIPIDTPIWLTPQDVARGLDTVVETAIKWINATNQLKVSDQLISPRIAALNPAFPNPFNPRTTVAYNLSQAVDVLLTIFDIQGREVATLVNSHLGPGHYQAIWSGKDLHGRGLPSGIYIARLMTPEHSQSIKMLLLK